MRIFYIFLILIINILTVNAEINIFKETYSQKETFQAELSFQNLIEEIKPNNILILEQNNQTTNIGTLLAKITDEKYFVYFDIPEIEDGSYFLAVNNIKYMENNILKKENFIKTFKIKKEENNLISINPSFINFKEENNNFFKINIKNKGNNIINIKVKEETNSTNIFHNNLTIAKNSENYFYFNLIEAKIKDKDKLNIQINYAEKTFLIPVYILKEKILEKLFFYQLKEHEKNYLTEYKLEFPFGNYIESALFLENNINKNLSNLSISLSENIKNILNMGFYNIEHLENNKSLELKFFINQNRNRNLGIYKGNLIIQNPETTIILPITINIIENPVYKKENTSEYLKEVPEAPDELTKEQIEEQKNQTQPIINQTIKQKKQLDKKTISYISISSVLLFFILIYLIIFIKTGRKRRY